MHRGYSTHITRTYIFCRNNFFCTIAIAFDLFNYSSFILSIYSDCRAYQFRIPNANRHFIIDTFYIPNVIQHIKCCCCCCVSKEYRKKACDVNNNNSHTANVWYGWPYNGPWCNNINTTAISFTSYFLYFSGVESPFWTVFLFLSPYFFSVHIFIDKRMKLSRCLYVCNTPETMAEPLECKRTEKRRRKLFNIYAFAFQI